MAGSGHSAGKSGCEREMGVVLGGGGGPHGRRGAAKAVLSEPRAGGVAGPESPGCSQGLDAGPSQDLQPDQQTRTLFSRRWWSLHRERGWEEGQAWGRSSGVRGDTASCAPTEQVCGLGPGTGLAGCPTVWAAPAEVRP